MNTSDQIALVTGSTRGIGRDIALSLADTASGVAVHFNKNSKAAEEVVAEIKKKGKKSKAFRADLTCEKEALNLIEEVEKYFGKVDILVNNFGPILVKPWEEVTSEEWKEIFQGNLLSALFCLKSALPGMRKRGWGRIINLGYSRVEQLTAFPTIAPYAVAKAGLLILTRTIAAAEASSGITVNMVSPGLVEGGVLPKHNDVPSGRLGKFTDVSQAVVFLSSLEAGYITGNNLVVAGGWKL
jgi:3-oxoacyl-[acyl-carrier protein] reductase